MMDGSTLHEPCRSEEDNPTTTFGVTYNLVALSCPQHNATKKNLDQQMTRKGANKTDTKEYRNNKIILNVIFISVRYKYA